MLGTLCFSAASLGAARNAVRATLKVGRADRSARARAAVWARPSGTGARRASSNAAAVRMATGDDGDRKSAIRIGAAVLLGLFLLSSLLPLISAVKNSAGGLGTEQINLRLSRVPVFSVTDADGKPYLTEGDIASGDARLGLFYLDPTEAEARAEGIQSEGFSDAKVLPVSLDQAVSFIEKPPVDPATKTKDTFRLQAKRAELEYASKLLGRTFSGVPLFYLDGLVLGKEDARVYPVFFNYEELQQFIAQLQKDPKNADFLSSRSVSIIEFSAALREMRSGGSTAAALSQMVFYPPEDGIRYLKAH
mmetsp:Transcript_4876/g.13082  ORF Transcript_4876/g.13082 Transcript_4876/m.13082 type:complete len:306 (-) Transcript_4876:415-1332(-)